MARPVTILNHLGPDVRQALLGHACRPEVISAEPDCPPWIVSQGVDAIVTSLVMNWKDAPAERPAQWPDSVRWVQSVSSGVDMFPSWLFRSATVTSGRGIVAGSVAEYVMAAILGAERRFPEVFARSAADWLSPEIQGLEGKTVGIVGYGAIGRLVAQQARAFGANVLALRRNAGGDPEQEDVAFTTELDSLLANADHLVLAMPSTPQTRRLINASALRLARPGMHIVNVARGDVIDQEALIGALDEGRVGLATLDVTDPEPLPAGHPLYTHPKVWLTPHIAWKGRANNVRRDQLFLENLSAFVAGRAMRNVVAASVGY